jgi:hypothetical protein
MVLRNCLGSWSRRRFCLARPLILLTLITVLIGCAGDEWSLNQEVGDLIPSPLRLPARPLLDTDRTYYSYFALNDGEERARADAEARLSQLVDSGMAIERAWVGTTQSCNIDELEHTARLVVRLVRDDSRIEDFGFVPDPARTTYEYPWAYWYDCDDDLAWRYDFEPFPDIQLPEPDQVSNEYPVPDSPTRYYRPWYVWGVTDEEWRAGVEAFIKEMIEAGISLKLVSVPLRPMDSCLQHEWPNTDVVIIETFEPEPKLIQLGIMTQSYNSMNMCPDTLWRFQWGDEEPAAKLPQTDIDVNTQ